MDRLEKQMQFILEVDKLKKITRQTYLTDGSRKENDAEHSWHLALMCMLLQEYSNEPIDVVKTMTMVLIHDVVEIDAGDTYAYDELGNSSKKDREEAAAERIFHLLPEDQASYMRNLWDEFEEMKTAEAKFANTLDKVQPLMLNDQSGGLSWREHEVKETQVLNRNANTSKGSEELWEYVKKVIDKNIINGNIKPNC
jgi:putative hydrolases of HD superfamily